MPFGNAHNSSMKSAIRRRFDEHREFSSITAHRADRSRNLQPDPRASCADRRRRPMAAALVRLQLESMVIPLAIWRRLRNSS
jgi:hypothetical protein